MNMKGKTAFITGGGAGIGSATAMAFAREGANVIVADLQEEEQTTRRINESGGHALFVKADVTSAVEVETAILKTVEHYGRLDYAFNNAGIAGAIATTADYTEGDFDRMIAADLKGVWLCMKYEILQMLKSGGGVIVNTSSDAGLIGTPTLPAYTAAKHGVNGLTKTAALEYARLGIRINAVCPGPIYTLGVKRLWAENPQMEPFIKEFCPMGRVGKPEEIAEAVVWLCSDAASFVTGAILPVDGGIAAR
jgi:NAD(P)-dependent dehydrogenase (short-subunit alcohol dehydrogenase family)